MNELFTTRADDFRAVTVNTYGEAQRLEILCLDLVWQAIREKLRFVLIKDDASTFILICSDLSMSPEEIVELYAFRFKIEVTFKMVKHIIGGLYYHFWTKAWPENVAKALTIADLVHMNEKSKKLIAGAMNAIEGFVNIALIATGLLQILALEHAERNLQLHYWWMRTYPRDVPSEEMMKTAIQHEFYHNFRKFKHTAIYRIIRDKRSKNKTEQLKMAAQTPYNFRLSSKLTNCSNYIF